MLMNFLDIKYTSLSIFSKQKEGGFFSNFIILGDACWRGVLYIEEIHELFCKSWVEFVVFAKLINLRNKYERDSVGNYSNEIDI